MTKIVILKHEIRRMVVHLTTGYNARTKYPLIYNEKHGIIIVTLQFIFLGFCFAACGYQVVERVNYFIYDPVVVDVFNEIVTERDTFALMLCSSKTPALQKAFDRTKNKNHTSPSAQIAALNVSADEFWRLRDVTKTITKAYFSVTEGRRMNLSLDAVATTIGLCTEINYDLDALLNSHSLNLVFNSHFRIGVNINIKEIKFVDYRDRGDYKWFVYNLNSDIQSELRITMEKFTILNRKDKICVGPKVQDECKMKCQSDYVHNLRKTCTLPFEKSPSHPNLPGCWLTPEVSDVIDHLDKLPQVSSCICPILCERTFFYLSTDFSSTGEIQIKFDQPNSVRLLKERRIYSIISLLCDIGGILSLFFGLSCLGLIEIISDFARWMMFTRSTLVFKKCVLFKTVSELFKNEIRQKNSSIVSKEKERNYAFLLIKILIIALCILQLYESISRYYTYPISYVVELVKHAQTPWAVLCLGSPNILNMLDNFSNRHNISRDKVDLLDLLGDSAIPDANALWRASADTNRYLFTGVWYSAFPTPIGNCTLHSMEKSITRRYDQQPYNFKLFFKPLDERSITYKEYDVFQCLTIYVLRYNIQTIVRADTPSNPCESAEEAEYCEQKCYQSKLLKTKITCGLPFIEFIDVSSCNSTKSAKRTKSAYLEAFMNTNAIKECSCRRRCSETLYWFDLEYIDKKTHTTFTNMIFKDANREYKEVVTEILSFSVENLICFIGSNLGSIIGISLMTLFTSQHIILAVENCVRF